jgi:hypothetical protein
MIQRNRARVDLFLVSVLGLYLELVVIRWLASEIRVFAYFKNFPLFAAFIGLGLGCYVAERRPIRWWLSIALLLVLSLAAMASEQLRLTNLFFPDPALYTWRGSILSPLLQSQVSGYPILGALSGKVPPGVLLALIGMTSFGMIAALFVVAATIFYPIGQETGRLFGGESALTAYTINVAGALVGSAAFTLLSYLETGPLAWLLLGLALLAYFAATRRAWGALALAAVACLLLPLGLRISRPPDERIVWSPYYRIGLTPGIPEDMTQGYTLRVNHDYFQRAGDLSPEAVARSPRTLEALARNYDRPDHLAPKTDRVLVVGAGMGNDVAAAFRAGAGNVTAVDIDPAILRLGEELHPEKPYAPGRARRVVDDARAYFRRHAREESPDKRFDLIVFGLLDSQTALSSMSSVRLEFYVYTAESLREALSLLDQDDGLMVITFSVGWRKWVGRRLYETIAEAAGSPPMALETSGYDGGITFVAGPHLKRLDRAKLAEWGAKDITAEFGGGGIKGCTDDWPFLYLNPDHWPWVYLLALGLLVVAGSAFVRRAMRSLDRAETGAAGTFDLHMFLMGAGFMLVETSAIARLSLVFGATWLVNAAVILAVMIMILAANALVGARKAPPLRANYALLIAALCGVAVAPFDRFLSVPGGGWWAALLVALPVLFSSLVFAEAFAGTPSAHLALGCNMLGAILGGVLESASLGTGIRSLALFAAGIYVLSAVAYRLRRRPAFALR